MRAGISIAVLVSSAAVAGDAPRFAWPNPRMVSRVEVPGTLQALGVPVRMQVLRLEGNIDALWGEYAAAFKRAGFFIPPRERQRSFNGIPMLTAYDPARKLSYSVALWANADGTVNAMLAEANLGQRRAEREHDAIAPVYPNASDVLVSQQEGARLMTYSARATAKEVSQFYGETLAKAGFTRDPESGGFLRGGERLDVQVRPADAKHPEVIRVAVVQRIAPLESPGSSPEGGTP